MAKDPYTILDVIQDVPEGRREQTDERIRLAEELSKKAGYKRVTSDFYRMADKRMPKIPEYVQEGIDIAMSEKEPTAGGTYKGSIYYSNILPEGKGDLPWSKKAATIVERASQTGAKKSDILAAQNYFAEIGYMHPSEVDGMPGKQFRGMVSRWNKNPGQSTEAIIDAMKNWKDNLFNGGAEEYEEDLREGGGDQGGY